MEMPSETVMVKQHALAPGAVDADGRLAGQIADVHVAGRDVSPGRGHADLRPAEVLVPEPDRPEHGARRGLPGAVHHDSRVPARIHALFHGWTLGFTASAILRHPRARL